MPKYYCHLERGPERIADSGGIEAIDEATAIVAANKAVNEWVKEEMERLGDYSGWKVTLTDEHDCVIAQLPINWRWPR
jgi:hypothetical protein